VALQDGVTLVVGSGYSGLKKAKAEVTASRDVTVCVPNEASLD